MGFAYAQREGVSVMSDDSIMAQDKTLVQSLSGEFRSTHRHAAS